MDPLTCAKSVYSGYQYNGRWAITDFWKRANTLDACIRFINAANSRWPADPGVQQMVNGLINRLYTGSKTEDQFFQPMLDDVTKWADDFFWCGLASLSAYDFLLSRYRVPGDPGWIKARMYLMIAQTSWLRLVGTGYDLATEAEPVPHGCTNSTASADPKDKPNPMGTKNTVTNAGLFLLSLRLYNALKKATPPQKAAAQGYLKMAYAQYRWFSQWFTEPNPAKYPYLKLVDLGRGVKGGLVNERPESEISKGNPPYEDGCVWTGDQGLILAALAGMLQIQNELTAYVQAHIDPDFDQGAFHQDVSSAIGQIATGTQKLLFGVDGIVREAPFEATMGYGFSTDYASGRGVLLRCLALPEVKTALLQQGVSFDNNLKKTASAVCTSLGPSPTYQVSTNLGVGQDDTAFQRHFEQLWGFGDDVPVSWTFPRQDQALADVVLQAVGLDVLGAAIPLP